MKRKLNDRESGLVKMWMRKGLSKAEAIARVRKAPHTTHVHTSQEVTIVNEG